MAKNKPRAPMPPRSVQAPKRRDTSSPSNPLAEVPRWVWFASAIAFVGAVIVIALLASSSSGNKSTNVKAAMVAAGCTYRDVPPKPPVKNPTDFHADVPTLTTPTAGLWSTDPPSGGAHYGTWAVWGFYTTAVNPREVVHNEEHGGVIIWWGPKVPASTVSELQAFYNQQPDGMFGTPYAPLGDKIALTAWTGEAGKVYYANHFYGMGHIAICSKFDQKAFGTFRSAYRGHGPEGVPLSADEPGMGPQ